MSEADKERKSLADMLDFSCFVAVMLLYGCGLLLLASMARATWWGAAEMLLAVLPLGIWLAGLVVLRHRLEQPQHSRWWWHWELREMKEQRAHDDSGPA